MNEQIEGVTEARHGFFPRLIGAAIFDVDTYEEVEADQTATPQAALVVGLVAVAAAIGGFQGVGVGAFVAGILATYLGWAIWSGTCYLVGVQLFDGTADWGELLRTVGFALAPGILLVLRAVPGLGVIVQIGVSLWMLATVLVAIRQALDFGTGRALATALAGFVPYVLATTVVEILLGITPSFLP